ncbi:MAG: hypothetical protein K2Y71_13670 [Xanthobacteraceae bacterium]|nr:hypothetical protein [Xanthobacteraceae bacterium]
MARNDFRRFRHPSVDRAPSRAGDDLPADAAAESWRALASVTVASTLVVAAVVSALALVEAVFSTSTVKLARQVPAPSEPQSRHARSQPGEPFLPTPVQAEPALHVAD